VDSERDGKERREETLPIIIPRSDHPISRKQIDEEALKVLYRLRHHGFLAYLVGGSVRDLLLEKVPKDFDVATDAHPHEVTALFRNSRIIGRRFRLVQVFFKGGKTVEVSTFRSRPEDQEVETEEGAIVRTDSFGTSGEDVFRRDITINGLFYNIADFSIIDYVGGMEDLRKGIIRTIGDPDERFIQDPVRMIRVIRHSARTGFPIDESTYRALLRNPEELKRCSPSRVRDEFLRDLKEGAASPSLSLMLQTGLLFSIFPDLARAFGDRNPSKDRARQFLLALFRLVDQRVHAGKPVPDSILLALLVTPLLGVVMPEHPYLGEKEKNIYRIETIRFVLHQTFVPYSFPKGTKEAAAQVLIAQANLQKSLRYGVIPKRMRMKRYFQEAVLYFGMEAQARGETVPGLFHRAVSPDFLPWRPKKVKRRHRR
jgi:poly(A) polymerase